MLRGSIDLLGLYNYDNTVLSTLVLPTDEEGHDLIDRSTLTDNLLMETAELELIYGSVPFMKTAIGSWSAKQVEVWTKLYETMHYEYNPIWNKDGTIYETITRNLAGTDNRSQDITRTDNLLRQDDYTRTDNLKREEDYTRTDNLAHTDDATTTTDVYGYNSSTGAPKTLVTVDNDTSDTGTQRNAGSTSDSGTQRNAGSSANTGTQRTAGTDNHTTSDTGTIATARAEQGNIGLTSTQELIKQQRDIVKFNVMDYIINDFKRRFCLMVY